MSCFPLETWGSHESRGARRTGVSPHSRLAILPVQAVQTCGSLNPRRSRWPGGPRQACWASNSFTALLCLGARWARCSSFAWESRRTRRAWKTWLALEALVTLLAGFPLGSSLSLGTHWTWGAWEALRSWWARLPLLSRRPGIASLPLDAGESWRAHGTWVTGLSWRTRFPFVPCQALEASIALKTRQSGGANSTRKTWGANRAWRTRGAPHARWTLFSSLAWQSWRTRQAGASSTIGIFLHVVSPGLLGSRALPLGEAPGAVVEAWHSRDGLVSLLSLFQGGQCDGSLALDTVPADALQELPLNG